MAVDLYARRLVTLLKVCASQKDLDRGSRIHADILKSGLLRENVFLGSSLVNMYSKCGLFARAQEVFDSFVVRDAVLWNALIDSYAQQGYGGQALKYFGLMQLEGISPDAVTFICILKACGTIRAAEKGKEIHAQISREGLLEKNVTVANALVDMYVKCGLLAKAQGVFDKLMIRDVVSWNVLMTGYAQNRYGEQVVKCFKEMQLEGISPNLITFVCVLKACGIIECLDKGEEVHAKIVREGLFEKDTIIGNALINMYAKCNSLAKAQTVFEKLPIRDVVSWNVLMAGYSEHGHDEQALRCYERMHLEGVFPSIATYLCVLKACGSLGAADKGKEIHHAILREGFLSESIVIGTALVDMYAKCGLLTQAQGVFDRLPNQNVISWNALVAGYTQHGHGKQALECFEKMQLEGFFPDTVTYICILKACGSIGAVDKGRKLHDEIVKEGLLMKVSVVGTALVDMYARCGLLAKAQEVFDELPNQDIVSWATLMSAYTQHGHGEKTLKCFKQMQLEGLPPNAVTYMCILQACSRIGAADKGKEIHSEILKNGLLKNDVVAGTALVDMYAKCGLLAKAQEVFDKLPTRNVLSWCALMAGHVLLERLEHVFHLFDRMIGEGVKPNSITFTILLNACAHAGLVERGEMYFESMRTCYGISPTLEHYTCMIHLFSCAGCLEKAAAVIKEMPFSADLTLWLTVLGACRKWGNLKFGKLAFEHAVRLDEKDDSAYVFMSNIYTTAGKQEEADKIEAMRSKNRAQSKCILGPDGGELVH